MADASELGIHPPSTVRIEMGGWTQDWGWPWVRLHGDHIEVRDPVTLFGRPLVRYEYEHCRELEPGRWVFHGREDFTVTAGPPQPLSVN